MKKYFMMVIAMTMMTIGFVSSVHLTMKWVKQLVALPPMSQVSLCSAIP